MKEANIIFSYCREHFPKSRNLVEDFSDEDEMMRVVAKNKADIYLLCATGAVETEKGAFKIAREIRTRHRDGHVLFTVDKPATLQLIVRQMLLPAFVFENEVTAGQVGEYFEQRQKQKLFGNMLAFTSENQKKTLDMQSILLAQTDKKRVVVHTIDRQYHTSLTIASLEQALPKNFIRVDKGVLVNGDYIGSYDAGTETVNLINGLQLTVSRRGKQRLKEMLGL